MTGARSWLALLLHAALVLPAGAVIPALIAAARPRILGLPAPPPLAWAHALRRLVAKSVQEVPGASFVSRAAPAVSLAASAVSLLLVPSFVLGLPTDGGADLLAVLGLLALSTGLALLAPLEAGTAEAGQTALRTAAALPAATAAAVAAALGLWLIGGDTNLTDALTALREQPVPADGAATALLAGSLAALGLGARAADPPDASGAALLIARLAGDLRLIVWPALIGALLAPGTLAGTADGAAAWPAAIGLWLLRTAVIAAALEGARLLLPPRRAGGHGLAALSFVLALLAVAVMIAGQTPT